MSEFGRNAVSLISVIVPVHNAERHLPDSLDSILGQTHRELEILLVDDGSTDGSAGILADYAARDDRVTVVRGPAVGSAGAARNAGLNLATGSYLSFLDADDIFAPTLLEELHARAVRDDADIVVSKFRYFHDGTQDSSPAEWSLRLEYLPAARPFSPRQVADQLFFAVSPAPWNKLFRADFVREKGLRFQPLRHANDVYFTLLALAQAERITYLDRVLVQYRIGNQASLQSTLDTKPLEFIEALEATREGLRAAGLYEVFERAFVNQALVTCLSNLKRQRTPAGFRAVHEALRSGVLERFGVTGRPPEYFVRADLATRLAQVLESTPDDYLFARSSEAQAAAERAEAELRRARRLATPPAAGTARPAPAETTTQPVATQVSAGQPDVTVIIPVHNTELYLRECLDSVLRQSSVTLEVICVDDGSTDGSPLLLDSAAAQDDRVRVVHQPNSGPSVARNTALPHATGRYVCFLDSDDYWRRDGLAELVGLADASALDLLMFDAVSQREPGVEDRLWARYRQYYTRTAHPEPRTGSEMVADLQSASEYRPSPCLYLARREFLERTPLRFYPGIRHEDDLFTFQAMLQAGRVSHVTTPLYARRIRPGSIVTAVDRMASARGYLVSYIEMLRSLSAHRSMEPRAAAALGSLVQFTFQGARNDIVKLSEEQVEQLADVDPAPDAQAAFQLLRRSWLDERKAKLLAKRLKLATGATPGRRTGWRSHPAVVRIKSVLKPLLRKG